VSAGVELRGDYAGRRLQKAPLSDGWPLIAIKGVLALCLCATDDEWTVT